MPEAGQQSLLRGQDTKSLAEKAVTENYGRELVNWLNALHRANGRMQSHRGFQHDAEDVQAAVKRFRKMRLKPADVIAVLEHRVAYWRAKFPNWLDNCKPGILFAPKKFSEALEEVRAGFKPDTSPAQARRFDRPGAVEGAQEDYTTETLPI